MTNRALSVPSFNRREDQDSVPAPLAADKPARAPGRPVTALALALCLASVGATAAGCSSSDDGAPFAEYQGTWRITLEPTLANSFRLNCPDLTPPFNDDFPLFTTLRLEPGTVTDLYDRSGGTGQLSVRVRSRRGEESTFRREPRSL